MYKPIIKNHSVRNTNNYMLNSISIGSTGFAQALSGKMHEYDEKQKFAFDYEYKAICELLNEISLPIQITVKCVKNIYEDDMYYHEWEVFWVDEEECNLSDTNEEQHNYLWEILNKLESIDWDSIEEKIIQDWADKNVKVIPLKKVA